MDTTSAAQNTGARDGFPPAVLRMAPAAHYIGVSRAFLYLLVERGELLRIKLGGRAAGIRKADLDRWLDSQSGG